MPRRILAGPSSVAVERSWLRSRFPVRSGRASASSPSSRGRPGTESVPRQGDAPAGRTKAPLGNMRSASLEALANPPLRTPGTNQTEIAGAALRMVSSSHPVRQIKSIKPFRCRTIGTNAARIRLPRVTNQGTVSTTSRGSQIPWFSFRYSNTAFAASRWPVSFQWASYSKCIPEIPFSPPRRNT